MIMNVISDDRLARKDHLALFCNLPHTNLNIRPPDQPNMGSEFGAGKDYPALTAWIHILVRALNVRIPNNAFSRETDN